MTTPTRTTTTRAAAAAERQARIDALLARLEPRQSWTATTRTAPVTQPTERLHRRRSRWAAS